MTRYYRGYDREVDTLGKMRTISPQHRKLRKKPYDEKVRALVRAYLISNSNNRFTQQQTERALITLMTDHVWTALGRPTWFISPEMLELLEDMSVEARIDDALMPHDTMAFVFPRGTRVAGIPCRSMFAYSISSERTLEIADLFYRKFVGTKSLERPTDQSTMDVRLDFGAQVDGSHSEDLVRIDSSYFVLPRDMTVKDGMAWLRAKFESDSTDQENQASLYMISIMVKALLYVQAVKAEGLASTPRPQGRKARTKGRKKKAEKEPPPWEFTVKPTKDILRAVAAREGAAATGGGKGCRPHMRGWVLRVLRHERYRRNADGSPRTVLVAPHLVGTKDVADLRGGTKAGGELNPE
jgi:hypothetical protein